MGRRTGPSSGVGKEDHVDAVYGGYSGKNRFFVHHEKYGECRVAAKDENSAIVAAASFFGAKWTKIEFYANCRVTKA